MSISFLKKNIEPLFPNKVWLSYTSKFPAAARILFGANTGVAMRKFIVLVLASLCVLSVGACAPKAPPPTPIITK